MIPRQKFLGAVTSVMAASVGLVVVLVAGVLAWEYVRGVPGIILATVVGGGTAALFKRFQWPASVLAGGFGALVGGYFAIAAAERFTAGSLEWAVQGGAYGTLLGIPLAAVCGFFAARAKSHI